MNNPIHNQPLENKLDATPENVYGKTTQTSQDISYVLKYGDGSSRDAFLRYLDALQAHFRA